MGFWIALSVVLCWAAVAACWLIVAGAREDREMHARAMRRQLRGAGREPEAIDAAWRQ